MLTSLLLQSSRSRALPSILNVHSLHTSSTALLQSSSTPTTTPTTAPIVRSRPLLLNVEPEPEVVDESYWPITRKSSGDNDGSDQVTFVPPAARVYHQKRVLLDEATQQFGSVGVGRRKTAVARVMVTPGVGDITLNGRNLVDFVSSYRLRDQCVRPLIVTETLTKFDVTAETRGGGTSGQIGAVVLGLARALQNWDPDWRLVLKREQLLIRDPRMVERKKTGQPKARKRSQWSKR